MKLPKNFGGQGFGGIMQQYKDAMTRAQSLESELAAETFEVDKGPVKAVFNGVGEIQKITIDPSMLSADEGEALEDLIVVAVRDGFQRSVELRNRRLQEIMPNIPGL
jgi:DNA-binding YbaB/EbfC family protein